MAIDNVVNGQNSRCEYKPIDFVALYGIKTFNKRNGDKVLDKEHFISEKFKIDLFSAYHVISLIGGVAALAYISLELAK